MRVRLVSWFFIPLFFLSHISFSAEKGRSLGFDLQKEEEKIPKVPLAPSDLTQKSSPSVPHCERYFTFQGKKLEADSQMGMDAQELLEILKSVPSAASEIQLYRDQLEKIKLTSYLGSLGLLAVITGLLMDRPLTQPDGSLRPGGYLALAGGGISVGSLILGFSWMKANEVHLSRAVDAYNAVYPERPIELQFSTHFDF